MALPAEQRGTALSVPQIMCRLRLWIAHPVRCPLDSFCVSAQAHKFLTGYAPIRSMARVGAAAGALLAIPAEQLKQGAQPRPNVPPVSRQVQRGLTRALQPHTALGSILSHQPM